MSKAIFFNVPAHGHINPSLPLVTELVKRGHAIIYYATEGYRALIEATGATFRTYRGLEDDFFDARGLSGKVPIKTVNALVATAGDLLPELVEMTRAERPDYILHDGACAWGLMVAQILKLPAITSLSLMPNTPPSRKMILDGDSLRFLGSILVSGFGEAMAVNKRAKALSQQYGIPALGVQDILNAYGDLCISYSSTTFVPNAFKTRANIRYVGWTPTFSGLTPAMTWEHAGKRKVIYASLGTINNDEAGFFKTCIEAFADSEYYVILSTGKRIGPDSFGTLPENIAVYSWVSQRDVLEHASLFITHGGMNSVHDGLYFGVPLLVVPQQGEQTLIALRVEELEGGIRLNRAKVNATTMRENAMRLLTQPRYQEGARRICESLRTGSSGAKAADEVEAFLKSKFHGKTN